MRPVGPGGSEVVEQLRNVSIPGMNRGQRRKGLEYFHFARSLTCGGFCGRDLQSNIAVSDNVTSQPGRRVASSAEFVDGPISAVAEDVPQSHRMVPSWSVPLYLLDGKVGSV